MRWQARVLDRSLIVSIVEQLGYDAAEVDSITMTGSMVEVVTSDPDGRAGTVIYQHRVTEHER